MDNAQTHPEVAIPLPKAKKNMVQIGCICLMLSVAMYGLVFATLTGPILESVDAPGYVSLFSIVGAIGVSIMIPIGGKLGDLTGRRNIVVIPGMICALSGIAFAFVRSLWPLMLLRLLVSLAQGAFTSAPYIIVGQIHERKDVPKAMGMLATAVAAGGFGGIPRELDEAAIIDGCSLYQVYSRIVLPLSKPILAVVALFSFRNAWNDYITGLIMTISMPKLQTLTVAVVQLKYSVNAAAEWHIMLAGASIAIIPILIVYLFANKQFIAGLTAGAVKG